MTAQSVKQQVVAKFSELSGLELKDADRYAYLCTAAAEEFLSRLKSVPTLEQSEKLLNLFAAAAFHRYCCLCLARQQYSSMKLSDVSVTNNLKESCSAALRLKEMLSEDCADILAPKAQVLYSF